jgi:lipid-A-disaccharide synthase
MTRRIGLVAGEPSGDLIAARVLHGLNARAHDNFEAEGIGGPELAKQKMNIWHDMHALSVFGYVDALKSLPKLWSIFNDLCQRWQRNPPDLFLGVDAPDFNLRLEKRLKKQGVPTVHFVSPSIWAWRYERIHTIKASVDLMLTVFPFEQAIYEKEGIPVKYVGHPLADVIPMQPDQAAARAQLSIDERAEVLAILPGSRASEIKLMAPLFLQTAQRLVQQNPNLICLVPMVNAQRYQEFMTILAQYPVPAIQVLRQTENGVQHANPLSWLVLQACDRALVTSGTATLEAALFKRPMVISYVLSPWMRRLMAWKSGQAKPYLPWVGLPNVLANESLVPELLQDDATPEALFHAMNTLAQDPERCQYIVDRFITMHETLRCDTPTRVAEAIAGLFNDKH